MLKDVSWSQYPWKGFPQSLHGQNLFDWHLLYPETKYQQSICFRDSSYMEKTCQLFATQYHSAKTAACSKRAAVVFSRVHSMLSSMEPTSSIWYCHSDPLCPCFRCRTPRFSQAQHHSFGDSESLIFPSSKKVTTYPLWTVPAWWARWTQQKWSPS